jgi:large subunit ribosomal protein L25
MNTAVQFDAEARDNFGRGRSRALRNAGKIPSVMYGTNSEPVHFTLEEKQVKREYHKGGFFAKLVNITIDGKHYKGVAKDLQLHPVSEKIIHADFIAVEAGAELKVSVPVKFTNYERCIGIKRGGALNVVRYNVELLCHQDKIPEEITVDLLNLNIGDSVHISSVNLPEGSRSAIDRDFTIAAVAGRVSKAARESESGEGDAS